MLLWIIQNTTHFSCRKGQWVQVQPLCAVHTQHKHSTSMRMSLVSVLDGRNSSTPQSVTAAQAAWALLTSHRSVAGAAVPHAACGDDDV